MRYETMVGLEVHAELRTEHKLFCTCRNAFGAPPNSQSCPVCTGEPGTLPVLDRAAAALAVQAALALECSINAESRFDRKHYFYHDLPKSYQITQFFLPLAQNGRLHIAGEGFEKDIRIRQLHLEEDAAKSVYDSDGNYTVDHNRCGVPLIEIVTEPDFRSGEEARAFLEELRLILTTLGVSDGRLEEGSLRVDVNVSLRTSDDDSGGVRTELKNLGSFRAVAHAAAAEAARQQALLTAGEPLRRETRRWNEQTEQSELMRVKEELSDYLYLPEPDLPPLLFTEAELTVARRSLPLLPAARRAHYREDYGLSAYQAAVLVKDTALTARFEELLALGAAPVETAKLLLGAYSALPQPCRLSSVHLAALIAMIAAGEITQTAAKQVLAAISAEDLDPRAYATAQGLLRNDDEDALRAAVADTLAAQADAVAAYRAGKTKVYGYLAGEVMRRLGGRADGKRVDAFLREQLK